MKIVRKRHVFRKYKQECTFRYQQKQTCHSASFSDLLGHLYNPKCPSWLLPYCPIFPLLREFSRVHFEGQKRDLFFFLTPLSFLASLTVTVRHNLNDSFIYLQLLCVMLLSNQSFYEVTIVRLPAPSSSFSDVCSTNIYRTKVSHQLLIVGLLVCE